MFYNLIRNLIADDVHKFMITFFPVAQKTNVTQKLTDFAGLFCKNIQDLLNFWPYYTHVSVTS